MNGVIPFHTTDWQTIPATEHAGETGRAWWRTMHLGDLRIRVVEYSANYLADHWCTSGHVIYCIDGEMVTELKTGEQFVLKKGMSYQVSDEMSAHRSYSREGAKLFIIDGSFLKLPVVKHKKGVWM